MIIFKQTTHSLISDLIGNKKDDILKYLSNSGVPVDPKMLENIYGKLPENVQNKISNNIPLNSQEKTQEEIAMRSEGINIRTSSAGINALDALNSYYRENNPVAGGSNDRY